MKTPALWTGPFSTNGVSGKFLSLQCFKEFPVFNENNVDPDQTLCSTLSRTVSVTVNVFYFLLKRDPL